MCAFQVYSGSWGDLEGIIKCHMEDVPHYDLEAELEPRRESAAFNRPTKGTSVEKFREMVLSYLKVRAIVYLFIFYPYRAITSTSKRVQRNINGLVCY